MNNSHHLAAIILAAGKGKRMQGGDSTNKVISPLARKPMIKHIVEFMEAIFVEQIVVVVGHAKESVQQVLTEHRLTFAEQSEQLGTGHAVGVALTSLRPEITDVMVVYGDDAVLYSANNSKIISELIAKHYQNQAALTFLTIEQQNPFGLGRIVRDANGHVQAIVEEKNATEEQKKITEINPGCFIFQKDFLSRYLDRIEKNVVSGEYYLTDLVDIALQAGEKVQAIRGGQLLWRGVNTQEE
ncbi:MAG TPA: sugar phosphate nucleotidyltransferase, partial [Patescibacteria group bacterium]|nr:sugar phosphate nucleotidyltransferase [Patescibacteria group bacterium]